MRDPLRNSDEVAAPPLGFACIAVCSGTEQIAQVLLIAGLPRVCTCLRVRYSESEGMCIALVYPQLASFAGFEFMKILRSFGVVIVLSHKHTCGLNVDVQTHRRLR